jgi:hypothetical protein
MRPDPHDIESIYLLIVSQRIKARPFSDIEPNAPTECIRHHKNIREEDCRIKTEPSNRL